jgi:Protein of unknown function (DUF3489)
MQRKEPTMTKQKKTAGKKAAANAAMPRKARPAPGTKPTSKLSQIEAMLRRPEGATIAQLTKALDWQAHSVRGAMSGTLKKKQGLTITATKNEHADRVYRIAG